MAATPRVATAGGMFGPIAVYPGLASVLGSETYSAEANGWAIPTATDVAFSYIVGRLVFGAGYPAVRFLLLLAMTDDAPGLITGKPFGMLLFGWPAAGPMRLGPSERMRTIDFLVVGCIAAIGSAASLFIASVALDPGPVQDAAKTGALFRFAAAVLSFCRGFLARVEERSL